MNKRTKDVIQPADDAALEWLVLLQSPDLTADQEKAFFAWLQACPENQQAFVAADSLWRRGAALSKTSRIKKGAWGSSLQWLFEGWHLGAFAGVCAALMVAVFIGVKPIQENLNYQTVFGEQKQVSLNEGSVITLNANSDILVDLRSNSSRSLILNKGEVFFDVAPDKDRPFTVKTEEGLVVVLGTKFSVIKNKGSTQVIVIEGRVGLLPDTESWEGQKADVVLVANQQLALDVNETEPKLINADKVLSWRYGQLRFDGEPLSEVVSALNAYYNQSLSLASDSLASKRVVAVFPLSNAFEANVKYLEQALNLQSKIASNGLITLSLQDQ